MALSVCILADPVDQLNPAGDSSIALAQSALTRGHAVAFTDPARIWRANDAEFALTAEVTAVAPQTHALSLADYEEARLDAYDVIIMRKDPPIDANFTLLLHLLAALEERTHVVNSARGLLTFGEKLMSPPLLKHMPETLVTQDRARILAFVDAHKDVVLKPIYRNGGFGVVRLTSAGMTANAILDLFLDELREPVMVQRFLPEVFEGDKRVIIMGDKIAGGFARLPDASDFRSNLVVGGAAADTELSAREQAICEDVIVEMKRFGLTFIGLDLIGERLTEVNVTSPTGIRPLMALRGVDAAALFWDAIEADLA